MARTVQTVYNQLVSNYVTEMASAGFATNPATWSIVNLRRVFFTVVALCIVVMEQLFDTHTIETDDKISRLKPHSLRWYADKAKLFQYGSNLVPDMDYYDNTNLTPAQVAAQQVIKYCAVVEQEISIDRFGLRVKVAALAGSDLDAVPGGQLNAFVNYMKRIKDAGVALLITTGPADSLKCKLRIFYDPLVLDNQGRRLDASSNTPVQDAFKGYLKELPFNGYFVQEYLVDQLQAVPGVVIPQVDELQARYGTNAYAAIDVTYIPDSGYLRIYNDADLVIVWIAQNPIKNG